MDCDEIASDLHEFVEQDIPHIKTALVTIACDAVTEAHAALEDELLKSCLESETAIDNKDELKSKLHNV